MSRRGPNRDPIRTWARRPLVAALAVLVLSGLLGGCDLLKRGLSDGPAPTPVATYEQGTATVSLGDGTTQEFDHVDRGILWSEVDASVAWAGHDGWTLLLTVTGFGKRAECCDVTIDRMVDDQMWTTLNSTGCAVTIDELTSHRVAGRASCKGLAWHDAISILDPASSPIGNQPPFDAELTFEATP